MKAAERQSESFLDRGLPSAMHGGFAASNIIDATVKKVHTDESGNITFTCDVVTQKGEQKYKVPILFPYANAVGKGGIWSVPNEGDRCLVALGPSNSAYIMGFHAAPQLSQSRATPALDGESPLKSTFAVSQLIPGAIELRTTEQNRILLHPGGSIAIDAKTDLFTFYDAISSTIETLARNMSMTTAGGSVLWREGDEKARRSMRFETTMFTKSATQENLDKGSLRGGAKMSIIFSETANHFFLEVKDSNDITSRIQLGPNGVILTASDGINQGSIAVSPDGNFVIIAGNPNGPHTQLSLSEDAIAITALIGSSPIATVIADTRGEVKISSQGKVTLDAPTVVTQGGRTNLGSLGGLAVARMLDPVVGSCPAGTVIANIQQGSTMVTAL